MDNLKSNMPRQFNGSYYRITWILQKRVSSADPSCSCWYTKIAIRVCSIRLDKIAAHTKIFNMKLPFIRHNDCFSGIIYSTLSTLLSYIQTVSKPNNILSIFEFWYRLFHSSFARSLPLTFPHVF